MGVKYLLTVVLINSVSPKGSRCWNRRNCFHSFLPVIQIIYSEANSQASDGSYYTHRLSIYQSPWIYVYKVRMHLVTFLLNTSF
jgi:hypothetical protein